MIKFICNNEECKKEIDVQNFFAELSVKEVSSILLPGKKNEVQPQQQITEKKYHFCQDCLKKLLKEAKA